MNNYRYRLLLVPLIVVGVGCSGITVRKTSGVARYERPEQAQEAVETAKFDAISNAIVLLARKKGRLEGKKIELTLMEKEVDGTGLLDGVEVISCNTSRDVDGAYRVDTKLKVRIVKKAHEEFIKKKLQELKQQSVAGLPTVPTVAIWRFFESKDLPQKFTEEATASAYIAISASDKFKVVDRRQIEEFLPEIKLQAGGWTREIVAKIGRLLGAQLIIFGQVPLFQGQYIVRIELVHVETGQTLAAGEEGTSSPKKIKTIARSVMEQVIKQYAQKHITG